MIWYFCTAGCAELSALDVTSSESSTVSSQSERVVENKSNMLHESIQRPNAMQNESPVNQRYDDPGQNTSDEDQDDLPYDGDLGSPYFNQTAISECNFSSDGRETIHASPDIPGFLECDGVGVTESNEQKPTTSSPEDANRKQGNFLVASKPNDFAPSCPCPTDINQLLLRHFSQEELLQPGLLIDAETLPEVSLLESTDDPVFSLASRHNSKINNQSLCSGTTDEKSETMSKNSIFKEDTGRKTDNVPSAATDSVTSSSEGSGNTSAIVVAKQENSKEDDQVQRVPLIRTRSFSEMKYGQGQVHYPLPDFSKVAPKVKIPKIPSGQARAAPQSASTMHRTQSSPGMLEVISRVLEESVQPLGKPFVFQDADKNPSDLVHHLQVQTFKMYFPTAPIFYILIWFYFLPNALTFLSFYISLGGIW